MGFDAPVLRAFEILPDRGWKLRKCVIESPPVILSWRRDDRTIMLLDTLNWWRVPLKALGESVGVPKLTMPERGASLEEWDIYARQDVEVIRTAVHHWWDFLLRLDLGGFAPTLASQAFRAFRHRFLESPILVDDHVGALAVARGSYFGGRVEAYRIGRVDGPVHHFDVNAMYPWVMRDQEFPTVLRLTTPRGTLPEVKRWIESYCLVADCLLETQIPRYAVRLKDRLVFPVGTFRTALTTPDLMCALRLGHLREVSRVAVYERAPVFASFVSDLYRLRLDARSRGNDVQSYLLKILMNSLYGKFAQRGQVWEKRADTPDRGVRQWIEIDAETGVTRSLRQFAGIVQERTREAEGPESHPAIAAHVTAYAREALYAYQEAAGRGRVVYCDTDSLFTLPGGSERLLERCDPTALGALKLEGVYPWMIIHGAKDYETPGHKVVKGVRGRAEWLDPNTIRHEEWSTLTGLVHSGRLDGPTTRPRVKVLRRVYEKGLVTSSGHVLPLTLPAPGHDDDAGGGP
jgi:hypothetical protein